MADPRTVAEAGLAALMLQVDSAFGPAVADRDAVAAMSRSTAELSSSYVVPSNSVDAIRQATSLLGQKPVRKDQVAPLVDAVKVRINSCFAPRSNPNVVASRVSRFADGQCRRHTW